MNVKDIICGDLFAGGGGTTTGALAVKGIKVAWALNHSELAIKTHELNHPETIHYQADIRTQNEKELCLVDILWASIECQSFSLAKGGQPKDEGSRTLAWELPRYISHTKPKVIIVENVREFMSWGPLDSNMKPISMKKGLEYERWVNYIKSMGYTWFDYRILDSADYGAHTTRRRYFGVFCLPEYSFEFPEQTHAKDGGLLYKPWNACKEHIDLSNTGKSIFGRKKPIVENSLRRIAAGIKKYAPEMSFIMKYYGNGDNISSLKDPLHTITTKDRHAIVTIEKIQFLTKYYNSSNNPESQIQSIDSPAGTITTANKLSLVTIEKRQFVSDHICGASNQDINRPLNTIVTKPLKQLVTVIGYECDFDIKIRFLTAQELSLITGFPADYKYNCSNANALHMIGNAVPPVLSKVLIEAAKNAIKGGILGKEECA